MHRPAVDHRHSNLLRQTGDILEDNAQGDGVFVFRIRKAAKAAS